MAQPLVLQIIILERMVPLITLKVYQLPRIPTSFSNSALHRFTILFCGYMYYAVEVEEPPNFGSANSKLQYLNQTCNLSVSPFPYPQAEVGQNLILFHIVVAKVKQGDNHSTLGGMSVFNTVL